MSSRPIGLRKVRVFKLKMESEGGFETSLTRIFDGHGYFHKFADATDSDGNYPVAIIEREEGTVELPPADCVEFVEG